MKIPKLKLKNLSEKLKKLPRIFAERILLTFFGLILISLIFGSLLYYKYNVLARKTEPQSREKLLTFKEKTYEAVLKIWQEREKRFQEADFGQYLNPFK